MQMKTSDFLPMLAAVAALTLAGCGGGGGGSSTPPPQNLSSAPVAAALNSYYQANHGFDLSASSGGNTFTLQYGFTLNGGTTTFNGVNADSANVSVTLSENGTLVATAIDSIFFSINPFVPIGTVRSDGAEYGIITTWNALPSTLSVGQSGPLFSETVYHDSTEAVIDGTEAVTYSVNAVNSTSLQFCENVAITANANSDGLTSSTSSVCYIVNASGSVTGITYTITVNGTTLQFQ
jgi:hypothetical protein